MTYDEWKLSGPEEHPDPEMIECDQCDGTGTHLRDEHGTGRPCHTCGGEGTIPKPREEPDDDYLYERERDRRLGL